MYKIILNRLQQNYILWAMFPYVLRSTHWRGMAK